MIPLSVFDRGNLPTLQKKVLSGEIDSDTLLPDLVAYIDTEYYNVFRNLDTGECSASPVSRRGNPQYALRQSRKKSDLSKILRDSSISYDFGGHTYSHLLFLTLTIDRKIMGRDAANLFITTRGKGISRFFARLEKHIEGGYSKVLVKESTSSGYPAVHVLLHLDKAVRIAFHRKSDSYRPDPSDPYTKNLLGKLKNLSDWNSKSPLWGVGFIDVYAFTSDDLGIKGYSNPINYIAKYISKSLDIDKVPELRQCKRVSELPIKFRTAVWTILNNLIWNSHTWVISRSFKDDMKRIKEKLEKFKGNWLWVGTFHREDPRLYSLMGYDFKDSSQNLTITTGGPI